MQGLLNEFEEGARDWVSKAAHHDSGNRRSCRNICHRLLDSIFDGNAVVDSFSGNVICDCIYPGSQLVGRNPSDISWILVQPDALVSHSLMGVALAFFELKYAKNTYLISLEANLIPT